MADELRSVALLETMQQLHPLLIDLSLDRIQRLLAAMDHPERRLPPVLHVAGTNGKGSTVAFARAMLEAAGKRVHVYTSPHLVRFHERIVLATGPGASAPIDEAQLVDILERTLSFNGGASITFFEITTAAALLAFAETPADVVLLEVGLGGRCDTTNVVASPAVSVITPVAMDHADKLGDTLGKIAAEKAGILRRGTPAVIAPQSPQAREVIEETAAKVGAPLIKAKIDFDSFEQAGRLVYQTPTALRDLPLPALHGRHQIVNAGVAIAALEALGEANPALIVDEEAVETGLRNVRWPARLEWLQTGALRRLLDDEDEVWLDGGHNPAAGKALARAVAEMEERAPKALVMVVGMMAQKDVRQFLSPFVGLAARIITVPVPSSTGADTASDPLAVARVALDLGLDAVAAPDVRAALKHVRFMEPDPVRVLICGSLYLAGAVLSANAAPEA